MKLEKFESLRWANEISTESSTTKALSLEEKLNSISFSCNSQIHLKDGAGVHLSEHLQVLVNRDSATKLG